ncbi:MAG: DUF2779 domain-containing protein [Verrucomicrobiota bacterium]
MAPGGVQGAYLSKSKFLWGLQCHKLLWQAYNAKDKIPPPDAQTQAVFDQGHEVGSLAQKMFPDGSEVGQGVTDLEETIRLTKEALKLRKPLFEAAFAAEGGYCRVDILMPFLRADWDIVEVKSTTSLKDFHLDDLAFQSWVLSKAGLGIRACHLMHINPDYVRQGPVDPEKLFLIQDVTAQAHDLWHGIEDKLADQFKAIRQPECPEVGIGPQCDDPYECPLHNQCWSFLPPDNVLTLYRGGKKGFNLLADGILGIRDIPDGYPLTKNQEIQRRVAVSGKPHVSKAAIKAFLRQLEYPVSYLDFETFGTAIPLFDQTRPYEQVPFQFSLRVVRSPGSQPEHHMFLADGRADPRREFLQRLRDRLPDAGSIVAYNAQFELGRLRECCELHPDFRPWLTGVEARMVDLLNPFRAFRYYAPGQNGSARMKAVLPALTGHSYDHLAIQEGGTASLEFLRVHFTDVPDAERQRVRRQLEEYCGQDTEGMIWVVEALEKSCR